MRKAAEAADIDVIQVLDEAAAVLVGYRAGLSEERKARGLLGRPDEGNAGEEEAKDKRVVVLDMGETSLAVSVIQVAEGEYTVLAKAREDKLGGREFDNLVSFSLPLVMHDDVTNRFVAPQTLCQGIHQEDQGCP